MPDPELVFESDYEVALAAGGLPSATRSTGSSPAADRPERSPATDRLRRWRRSSSGAEEFLARVPEWIWDGESLPVPVEEIADTHFGLLVRDVEDMTRRPGCPPLGEGQSISGLLLPSSGEIWVNAAEAREWPPRRRFTIGHELGHWVLHQHGQQSLFCRHGAVERGRPKTSARRSTRSRRRRTSSPRRC